MQALAVVAGVGCALIAGVFFAFSVLVLPALARVPDDAAAEVLRAVNVVALRPPLMVSLFGTAVLCVVLGVLAADRAELRLLVGCATHVVGVVLVTAAANVPLNRRLADRRLGFAGFVRPWARWNHVRAAAGVVAAGLLLFPW